MSFFGDLLKIISIGAFFVATGGFGIVASGSMLATALQIGGYVLGYIASLVDRSDRLNQKQRYQMSLDPGAPLPVVYGKAKVGGIMDDWKIDSINNQEILYMVVPICHGSQDGNGIASVDEIWVDNLLGVTVSGDVRTNFMTTSALDYQILLGTTTQNVGNTTLTGLSSVFADKKISDVPNSNWSATTDTGKGITTALFRLLNVIVSDDHGPTFRGPPSFAFVVTGVRVYDTRISTWVAGGDNPAMCIRDYLLAPIYGCGFDSSLINTASFEAAADYCDLLTTHDVTWSAVTVSTSSVANPSVITTATNHNLLTGMYCRIAGHTGSTPDINGVHLITKINATQFSIPVNVTVGGTGGTVAKVYHQKRYQCNGAIDTSRPTSENLQELLSSCRGTLIWEQGQFKLAIRSDSAPAASVTLNPSNIIGEWSFRNAGLEDKWNIVTCNYINPMNGEYKTQQVQWPIPGATNNYLTADGGFTNKLDLSLPFTTDQLTAQSIAQITLNESRLGISCQMRCTEEALALSVGDLVNVTHPTPAWTAKPFWVEALQLMPDTTVGVSLKEYDPSAYSPDTIEDVRTFPATGLPPLPIEPDDPTNMVKNGSFFNDFLLWDIPITFGSVQAEIDATTLYNGFPTAHVFQTAAPAPAILNQTLPVQVRGATAIALSAVAKTSGIAGTTATIIASFYDADGTLISAPNGPVWGAADTTFSARSLTVSVPVTASTARYALWVQDGLSNAGAWFIHIAARGVVSPSSMSSVLAPSMTVAHVPPVFNVKDPPFNATGTAEATAAIQAAIDICPRQGIVLCPPVDGGYEIGTSASLIVKAGVRLVGQDVGPSRWRESTGIGSTTTPEGTMFKVTSTSNPPVILRTGASIDGVRFWYPNQAWDITSLGTSFTTYPAAIQLGDSTEAGPMCLTIRDIEFLGATRCIGQYATDGTAIGELMIEGCRGVLLGEFLRLARATDITHVRHCHFTPNAVTNYVGDGTVGGDIQVFRTKCAQAAKVFHLGNVDDVEAHDVFAYGVLHFAHWNNGFYTGDPNDGGGGTFVNCAADGCYEAFKFERSNNTFPATVVGGWYVTNFRPTGSSGDSTSQALCYTASGMTNLRIQFVGVRTFGSSVSEFVTNYSGSPDNAFVAAGAPGSGVNILGVGCSFANHTAVVNSAILDNVRLTAPVADDVMQASRDRVRFVLTDAATIAVDANSGDVQEVTLTATGHTMGAPSSGRKAQRLTFIIKQNATGGFAFLWNAVYKVSWSDTGNTANKFSSISFEYDGTNWNQDGAQSPYI